MGLFSKMFGSGAESGKAPKGFYTLKIEEIRQLTDDAVEITFDIPTDLQNTFKHKAGQYVNLALEVDGKSERRSYSICSAENTVISIGVKKVKSGKVSGYLTKLETGQAIHVSAPEGNFQLKNEHKNIVCFAAGSGITPILAIISTLNKREGKATLFYGNKNEDTTMFGHELSNLEHVNTINLYSQVDAEAQRIDASYLKFVMEKPEMKQADAYFICGPEAMINEVQNALSNEGIDKTKIHFELFSTPTKAVAKEIVSSTGSIEIILDGESIMLQSDPSKTILEQLDKKGMDVPYSCKGGVCCTCKAKVMEGTAAMKLNFSLTEEEVAEGYILMCQAVSTSEKLKISYDE